MDGKRGREGGRGTNGAAATKTSLDLISDKEDVVLRAELTDLGDVSIIRDDNTGFSLDGFDVKGGNIRIGLEDSSQRVDIVVGNELKARSEGPKVRVAIWTAAAAARCD